MESSRFVVVVAEVLVAWLVLSIAVTAVWNLSRHVVRARFVGAAPSRHVRAPAGRAPVVAIRSASPRTSGAGTIRSGPPPGYSRG